MKTKLFVLAIAFLVVPGFIPSGLFPQANKNEAQEKRETRSLIRKELLVLPEKVLPPMKRNIFTRGRGQLPAVEGEGASTGNVRTADGVKAPGQKNSPVEENRIDVKYIGYVRSGKKVVALILLAGETYAVESGDILDVGVTIGKITPDDMEIFDKGSEPIRINLEGEKP